MIVGDDLEFFRIRYMPGEEGYLLNAPCSGWQGAFVIERTHLFCPYTLQSFRLRADAPELRYAQEPRRFRPQFMIDFLRRQREQFQRYNMERDYATTNLILRELIVQHEVWP